MLSPPGEWTIHRLTPGGRPEEAFNLWARVFWALRFCSFFFRRQLSLA